MKNIIRNISWKKLFVVFALCLVMFAPLQASAEPSVFEGLYRAIFGKPVELNEDPGKIVCVTSFSDGILDVPGCIAMGMYVVLKGCAWVLWLAGIIFDTTLVFTLNIGAFIANNNYGLGTERGAIYLGWSTIRNMINVSFIFILLYAAIATILDLDGYNTKKTITKIVIAAMLLNFSLFFTKAIIDVSNLLALQFYTRILTLSARGAPANTDVSISSGLLNALGLKSLFGGGSTITNSSVDTFNLAIQSQIKGRLNAYQMILVCAIGSVLVLIFAFILLLAMVQFMFRSIVLILLMITAPVGFLAGAIPGMGKVGDDWWKNLKENAIFAPAYMAMLFVVCQVIFGPDQEQGNFIRLIAFSNGSSVAIVFWFILVIGLLVSTQVVAGKFASKFGSGFTKGMIKWGKGMGSAALGVGSAATIGMAARGARIGLGNTGRILSESSLMKKLATTPGLKQLGGQALYNKLGSLKDVKVMGKSYKDAIDNRVKSDQTTFERLGETTVRRRSGETDNEFKVRQTLAKNKALTAQARFGGYSIASKDLEDPSDPRNILRNPKTFEAVQELSLDFSEDKLKQYKREASSRIGTGRRKTANEVLKKANPSNKAASVDDMLKKAAAMEKELKDGEKEHKEHLKIYEDAVKSYFTTNEASIRSGDAAAVKAWSELKKAASGHKAERKTAESALENIQRQIKQAEEKK